MKKQKSTTNFFRVGILKQKKKIISKFVTSNLPSWERNWNSFWFFCCFWIFFFANEFGNIERETDFSKNKKKRTNYSDIEAKNRRKCRWNFANALHVRVKKTTWCKTQCKKKQKNIARKRKGERESTTKTIENGSTNYDQHILMHLTNVNMPHQCIHLQICFALSLSMCVCMCLYCGEAKPSIMCWIFD